MEQNVFQPISQFLSRLDFNRKVSGLALNIIASQSGKAQQEIEDQLLDIAHAMKRYKDQLQWQLLVDEDYKTLQIELLDEVRPLLLGLRHIEWETWRTVMLDKRRLIIALAKSIDSPNTLRVNKLGRADLRTLIEKILPEIDDLIGIVRDADVDLELKQVLYNALHLVRRAIDNYSISGTEGLIEAVQESLLFFDRYRDAYGAVGNEDKETQNLVKSTIGAVGKVVALVKTSGWPKTIGEQSLRALPMAEQLDKLL